MSLFSLDRVLKDDECDDDDLGCAENVTDFPRNLQFAVCSQNSINGSSQFHGIQGMDFKALTEQYSSDSDPFDYTDKILSPKIHDKEILTQIYKEDGYLSLEHRVAIADWMMQFA